MSGVEKKTPEQREEWAKSVVAEEGFSFDAEGMQQAVSRCDQQILALENLQNRARNELYMETLGIGEQYFPFAQAIVDKYKHKAIGGGQIAEHSSAVGLLQGHIDFTEERKLDFEAIIKEVTATDEQNAANINTIGNDL